MAISISILIPAYNAEEFIVKCLESLAAQTFSDFEIIVSNDGSTDRTAENVQNFITQHPHLSIKLLNNDNGGVSMARKRALEKARGEWVTFVDADDTLPSDALANLYSSADSNTDLIVGFLTPQKEKICAMENPIQWQIATMNGVIPPGIGAKLYRRAILKPSMLDIPRTITNGEDALMNIAYSFAMTKQPKFIYANVYNYTRHPLSLSHSTKRDIDYEYNYDAFRIKTIPEHLRPNFLHQVTRYRLNGVLGCSRSDAVTIARKEHPFFNVILEGIKQSNYRLSIFEWIAMNVKSSLIIKYSGIIRAISISLNYRMSLLFSKR